MRVVLLSIWVWAGLFIPAFDADATEDQGPLLCQQSTAPTCCGDACGPDQRCCRGTVCSHSGRCIPRECISCGDRGCDVDWDACTAECGPIRCCRASCSSDSDCCTGAACRPVEAGGLQCIPTDCDGCTERGMSCQVLDDCRVVCGGPICCQDLCNRDHDCCANTSCQTTAAGERRCLPTSCESCGGMTPTCVVSPNCEATCSPPPTCGVECTADSECGSGSQCREFSAGRKRCVPLAFEAECRTCGGAGCRFSVDGCRVECGPQ